MAYYQDDLAYGEEQARSPTNRWDRSRFERARSRGPPPAPVAPVREMESFRFEDDRYGPRSAHERGFAFSDRVDRAPARWREDERVRYYDDYYEDRGFQRSGQELAPYRNRWEPEPAPYYEAPTRRSFPPRVVRRQSSYDGFDRRGSTRYENDNVDIDIRRSSSRHGGGREEDRDVDIDIRFNDGQRQPVSPPPRVYEREYRYMPREDDYRDVRVVRERSIHRRMNDPPMVDDSDREVSEEEVKIEVKEEHKPVRRFKKGRTRFPKRLAHKRAIVELGEHFEEEEDFFVVSVALKKENIDEIIRISESYRQSEVSTKSIEPPPPPSIHEPEFQETEIKETITTKIIENPSPEEYGKYGIEPTPSESASAAGRSEAGRSSHVSRRSHHSSHHSRHRDSSSSSSSSTRLTTRRRSVANTFLGLTPSHPGAYDQPVVAHPYIPDNVAQSLRSYSPVRSTAQHRGRSKSTVRDRSSVREKSRLRSRSRFVGPDRKEVLVLDREEIDISDDEIDRRRGGEIEIVRRDKRESHADIKAQIRELEEAKRRLEREQDGGGLRVAELSIEKDRRGQFAEVYRKGDVVAPATGRQRTRSRVSRRDIANVLGGFVS